MRAEQFPVVKDLVLIGGGHTHALLARMWGMVPMAGVRVTLINPGPSAPYTGMLPGMIAGHYRRDEIMIDLMRLARFADLRLILDHAVGLDREQRLVHLAGRPPISYDLASIDVGIGSGLEEVPGFAENAVAAKPLGDYAARWQAFLDSGKTRAQVVVIGGGVGGVELAMASAHRMRAEGILGSVTVLEAGDAPLAAVSAGTAAALLSRAKGLGISFLTGAVPTGIALGHVTLADGRRLASDFTLSVTGARPQAWLEQTGLALHQGFIRVGPSLQSSDPLIFAAGDCAHMDHAPRPKAGVYAVRQAKTLAHNIRQMLSGRERLRHYWPQRDYLKMISQGERRAVVEKFGLRIEGAAVWRWKDRIDRKFMAKFADLAPMPRALPPANSAIGLAEAMGPKPLCGGCGSKLGPGALSLALASLPSAKGAEVLSGPGDDAAVLRDGDGFRLVTTDHLRAFCADPWLMARITAQHAMSDIWAMGGQPQQALAQIILPPLADTKAAAALAEVMAGLTGEMTPAGVDIIGGHSSLGGELTIGLTVLGHTRAVVPKTGGQPGDMILLTKPLGTGVIMAAEMAMARLPGLVLGEVVAGALASMTQGNGAAAAILATEARAMTDVTGFGLAGHLLEMLAALGFGARLRAGNIPFLPGARELAALGHGSSLLPANRAASLGRVRCGDPVLAALLHDPQTSGGLLAFVPKGRAEPLLQQLIAQDIPAALIGEVIEGAAGVEVAP